MAMFVLAAGLMLAPLASAHPAASTQACSGEPHAELDFWVGEWNVYRNGSETVVARSSIEKLYGGCAVRENWQPLSGKSGGSLSAYDPATDRWHQTWIGSAPGVVRFEGGAVDGAMVLTGWWAGSGPSGEDGITRMTYRRLAADVVQQLGEFSDDHGLTWRTTFDFIYRRRASD
jgi:hypothetical protein